MRVAIIGGGAAGFFSAIHVKEHFPNATVVIYEKSQKVLAKVKVSGGGRCNVTNAETAITELVKAYPRGGKLLKKHFHSFSTQDTVAWFEKRGVPLVTQEDNCIFPKSQDSQSIIDCLLQETLQKNIAVKVGEGIVSIVKNGEVFALATNRLTYEADNVIVTTGGSPKHSGLTWLEKLGHEIVPPVPSLFTFNMPSEKIRSLMGVVVEHAQAKIVGEKLVSTGPLLITHWGMSGPCILVLSAYGARKLAERNYQFMLAVNWVNENNQEQISNQIAQLITEHPEKQLLSIRPYFLPTRLWHFLLEKGNFNSAKRWKELSKKDKNHLVQLLSNDLYQVSGKTTFKEEFVTCGGVSLSAIHHKTLESKQVPGLFFAGEVLDIDAITGGYNFQAAWTTAYIAGKLGRNLG